MSWYKKPLHKKLSLITVCFSTGILSLSVLLPAHAMLPALQEIQQSSANQNNELNNQNQVIQSVNNDDSALTANEPLQAISPAPLITKDLSMAVVKTNDMGEKVLLPLNSQTNVQVGDIIIYQATITNNSQDRVKNMHVDFSIPQGIKFLGFENTTPRPQFATMDGSKFLHAPIIATINGIRQELPLSNYRTLRWNIEMLGIDENVVIQYQGQVK